MERRLSMIGSNMNTLSHKRNASSIRSIAKLQGPSPISLFITNLRLLDLDTLPDWPNLSTLTLSAGSEIKQRTRAVEWTLYQLFRLYDPHLTSEKLRPFFPPLEHLQSLNLRSALYRCLGELKKNGLLGREVNLRKTMLDECSGDKFRELCLSFSALVLRKLTLEQQERRRLPIAQRLGSASTLSKKDKESLLPLAIAHKSALSKVLADKHRRRESYVRLGHTLDDKANHLTERLHAVENAPPVAHSADHVRQLHVVEEAVDGQWSTDISFKDAVIHGDPAAAGDHLLLQKPHEFLENIEHDRADLDARRDSGVVEDIELKANAQNARVKDWQALHEQLQNDQRYSVTSLDSSRDASQSSNDLRFDLHQDFNVDDELPALPESHNQVPEHIPSYVSRYDEILTSMREELRRAQNTRRAASAIISSTGPARKPSITLDAVVGASRPTSTHSPLNRSISPTFPLRPGLNRRISSRSRSYQQPKVISQREPIPLKSEIFSPIKSGRGMSPASASSSRLASPVEVDEFATGIDTISLQQNGSELQSAVSTPATDSGVGLGVTLASDEWSSSNAQATAKSRQRMSGPRTVSFAEQPNLSQRTRMSISAASPDGGSAGFNDGHEVTTESGTMSSTRPSQTRPTPLAERARQSISAINFPIPIRTNLSAVPAGGSLTPLSPPKLRIAMNSDLGRISAPTASVDQHLEPAAAVHDNAMLQRNITPQERLFEPDAEYSSVFRSRPKIATSPVLSPTTNGATMTESSLLQA